MLSYTINLVYPVLTELLVSKFLSFQSHFDLERMDQLGIELGCSGSCSSSLGSITPVSEVSEIGGKVRKSASTHRCRLLCAICKKRSIPELLNAHVCMSERNVF